MYYYNTTGRSGGLLNKYIASAKSQNDFIVRLFLTWKKPLSPSVIQEISTARYGKDWPITSIRRSISNLTKKGVLIKTAKTTNGNYGRPEHFWAINTKSEYTFKWRQRTQTTSKRK